MINLFKQYQQTLEQKGFEAEFNPVNDNLVTIEIIGVPKKLHGQGYGSKIMSELCNMADKNGVILQLRPSASSTHSRTKLINFYSKFGFIENKGENKNPDYQYMYRLSKKKESMLHESLLLEKKSTYSYGCVMLDLDFPEIKKLHKEIKKEDLYEEKGNDKYGLEKEAHITLLYGLHKEITLQKIKDILSNCTFPEDMELSKIGIFEQDEYDVLKFELSNEFLKKINKKLKVLPFTNDYPDYKPHLTIAYLKKGKGKEYVESLKGKKYTADITHCSYSQPNGSKNTIKIEKSLVEKILKEAGNIAHNLSIEINDQPSQDYMSFTLKLNDKDIGFCNVLLWEDEEDWSEDEETNNLIGKKFIEISDVYIKPKYQGKGYSKILLKTVINKLKTTPYNIVILCIVPHKDGNLNFNNLQKLYTSFGFKTFTKDNSLMMLNLRK